MNIVGGVNPSFLSDAQEQVDAFLKGSDELSDWKFEGKKRQFLFEFEQAHDLCGTVLQSIAGVTGLNQARLMLCERHVKIYDQHADPAPPAHKDRLASTVAVAIPLRVPENSRLIVYPDVDAGTNPFQSTAKWRDSLDPSELPEVTTQGLTPTTINCQPGDVAMFRGSHLLHERVNAANSVLLFLKLNAMGQDPLGEDPRTAALELRTNEVLAASDDQSLLSTPLTLSPRFEEATRHYTRLDWQEVLMANLWAEKPFKISEDELALLRALAEPKSLATALSDTGTGHSSGIAMARRLMEKQAVVCWSVA